MRGSTVIGGFLSQRASNAESVFVWWRHPVAVFPYSSAQYYMMGWCNGFLYGNVVAIYLCIYTYIYHDNDAPNLTQIPKINLKMCCEKYYFVLLNRYYHSQSQIICPAFCKGYFRLIFKLSHWGRATHIFVIKLTIIVSDNGLSPGRHQAIIWTNTAILSIGPLGTTLIPENVFQNVVRKLEAILSRSQYVKRTVAFYWVCSLI